MISESNHLDWEKLDWERLNRLREKFINESGNEGSYWQDPLDLQLYDDTFAQRIAWKWLSVLRELKLKNWQPPPLPILDFGCGSGVAARTIVDFFTNVPLDTVFFSDRSQLAMQFAKERFLHQFPNSTAQTLDPETLTDWEISQNNKPFILLVSHVLNELNPVDKQQLIELIHQAQIVIIVEPGTASVAHRLVDIREKIRTTHPIVAPCTHQNACGLCNPENQSHWCHHYGRSPVGVFADPNWVKFGQIAGIDLRSLVYSFLVADKNYKTQNPDWERIIGFPREFKGYLKVLNCNKEGVEEKMFQKRDGKSDYKNIQKLKHAPIYQWNHTPLTLSPKDRLDKEGCHSHPAT